MSLPKNSVLKHSPNQSLALNLKLSDDLLIKFSTGTPKLIVKNGLPQIKIFYKDGSETILNANFQPETSKIKLYSGLDSSFSLLGQANSRLVVMGGGIKRSRSGTESKILNETLTMSGSSSESPPGGNSGASSSSSNSTLPKRPNKLVAISTLKSKTSPETRIIHLLALGPISISQIQTRCRISSYSLVETFLKVYAEVLTAKSLAYEQDKYFTYENLPGGANYILPQTLDSINHSEESGEDEKFYIIKDSSYQRLKIWDWKYTQDQRDAILKNVANAFDRMKLSAEDPLRKILINPQVLSQTLKQEEKLKEELKKKEFEQAQKHQQQLRLESAKQLEKQAKEKKLRDDKLKEEKLKEDKKSLNTRLPGRSRRPDLPPATNLPSVSYKLSKSSGSMSPFESKKTLSRSSSQTKVESRKLENSASASSTPLLNPSRLSPKKALSASPSLISSKLKKRKLPLAGDYVHSSDSDFEGHDELKPLQPKNSAANAAKSASSVGSASAENVKKKQRTASGSGFTSSSSTSSRSSMYKSGQSPYDTSPLSGETSSPEFDAAANTKLIISNISSSKVLEESAKVSTTAPAVSSAKRIDSQMIQSAAKFREKYTEYRKLYHFIEKNKNRIKSNSSTIRNERDYSNADYLEDVKRVIQLHNELTLWKKRLWSIEQPKASHSRSSSGNQSIIKSHISSTSVSKADKLKRKSTATTITSATSKTNLSHLPNKPLVTGRVTKGNDSKHHDKQRSTGSRTSKLFQ